MFKRIISKLAILLSLSVSAVAVADPFSVTWNETLSGGSDLPYLSGEPVSITFELDNGGTSALSQTWNATDVVSVTFVFNNAPNTITTVFDPNSGNGLSTTAGSFVTDGTGALTAVPSTWTDSDGASPIISSNDPQGTSSVRWWVNGGNEVYQNQSASPDDRSATAQNVATNTTVAAWSTPAPVVPIGPPGTDAAAPIPTMSTYGLVLTMLSLLLVAGRRLRA